MVRCFLVRCWCIGSRLIVVMFRCCRCVIMVLFVRLVYLLCSFLGMLG